MRTRRALPNLVSLDITLRARETDLYGDFNIGLENLCSVRKVSVKIRCTSCRRCEVDSAEADIRKAIVNNPNNPMFDITRCYEYELDEEQHHDNLEAIEEEEQLQSMPQRVGPWGGEGNRNHDIVVAPWRMECVKVSWGQVVDGIGFSYLDKNGKQHTTPLWGGVGGSVRMVCHFSRKTSILVLSKSSFPRQTSCLFFSL
uniref:Uncharacterized protein n=1 Tax=Oryza meridionalis TaxID=40149 RepID=A0A0E0F5Y1_9ORYZ